jgi:hypothetical protein
MKSSLSNTSILLMAALFCCCPKKPPATTKSADDFKGNEFQTESLAMDSTAIDSPPDPQRRVSSPNNPGHPTGDSIRPQTPQLRTYHNYPDPSLDSAKAAKKRKEATQKPNGRRP